MGDKKPKKYTFRHYVVAFLDILGQRDSLRKVKSLPDQENQEEFDTFISIIKETLGATETFRSLFFKFFNAFKKERPIPNGLSPEQLVIYKKLKEIGKTLVPKLQTFSDTIILYVPLSDDDGNVYTDGIYTTLISISGSFIGMMAAGYIFRGGVDIGIAVEINEQEVYGPAVLKAYDLESKIAKYPRIVMGDELIEFLRDSTNLPDSSSDSMHNKVMSLKCFELLFEDGDCRFALDYLGEGVQKIAGEVFAPLVPRAVDFLQRQAKMIKKKRNPDLFLRYESLSNYFDERLDLW